VSHSAGRASNSAGAGLSGALAGIKVVDFGQYIAGPLAAMLLTDQGAEVTHIDPPGGPRWKTPANRAWHRGKTVLELNLHSSSDLEAARRLIASTDVVVENFRPGVMDRLGLGADASLSDNSRLIYCSLPGFAHDDPRASLQAWEGVIAAATDTYRASSQHGEPHFTPVPIASHFGAILAGVSIAMALLVRERDGVGQRIEVALFDAMFAAIGAHGLFVDGAPGGNRPDDFWTGLFQCADQRWVQVSAATPRFRRQLAAALDLSDWARDGFFDVDLLTARPALREELELRQRTLFASRSAQDWEDLGGRVGVPIIKCRSTAEWTRTPHARAADIVRDAGHTLQPGPPVRVSADTSATYTPPREPASGTRPALDGVRVLDLTQVLAGPTAGRTLAEFGADVAKINNPNEEGAGIHFSRHRYHTDVNRGKRSILLDLKHAEGRAILSELIDRSDVFLQNFRPDAAERLGVTYNMVRQHRPDIVYVTVSAFGEPGPWSGWPGYEVQAQAASGLRYAGLARPAGQPFAVNDYGTGLFGAFAAALGLYARARTGRGQQAEAALAYTATFLQSAALNGEPNQPLGWSPLQRLYQASDGWFFLGATPERLSQFTPDVTEQALEELFRSATVEMWVERLTRIGIGAHRLASIGELMHDPWVTAHGLSLTRVHDTGENITSVGPVARLSRTPVQPGRPSVTPGADAADVLRDLNRESHLDQLVAQGVIGVESPRLASTSSAARSPANSAP
jgi:crotonobetainyl-CoA:carnitine CoA-transferase CaiB-like acyl-CoA transferase